MDQCTFGRNDPPSFLSVLRVQFNCSVNTEIAKSLQFPFYQLCFHDPCGNAEFRLVRCSPTLLPGRE